jgi:hypothetical protein
MGWHLSKAAPQVASAMDNAANLNKIAFDAKEDQVLAVDSQASVRGNLWP